MKRITLHLFAITIIALVFSSCKTSQPNLYVASKEVDCTGVGPQKCLLIKENKDDQWTFFYQGIEGFNYEPGYEYALEIKKEKIENLPADASSVRYILVKEITKEKKESENLPQ